jgi:hypothetical protein
VKGANALYAKVNKRVTGHTINSKTILLERELSSKILWAP